VATPELLFTSVTNKNKYITSPNGPPKTYIKTTSISEHVLFRFLPPSAIILSSPAKSLLSV
jgi:hypothetical protein